MEYSCTDINISPDSETKNRGFYLHVAVNHNSIPVLVRTNAFFFHPNNPSDSEKQIRTSPLSFPHILLLLSIEEDSYRILILLTSPKLPELPGDTDDD